MTKKTKNMDDAQLDEIVAGTATPHAISVVEGREPSDRERHIDDKTLDQMVGGGSLEAQGLDVVVAAATTETSGGTRGEKAIATDHDLEDSTPDPVLMVISNQDF